MEYSPEPSTVTVWDRPDAIANHSWAGSQIPKRSCAWHSAGAGDRLHQKLHSGPIRPEQHIGLRDTSQLWMEHRTWLTVQTRAVSVEWCGLVLRQQLMVVSVSEKTTIDQNLLIQDSCAIAKMTARCARALYKWIEWTVAEIWPFEIIRDGGMPPTWIWYNQK